MHMNRLGIFFLIADRFSSYSNQNFQMASKVAAHLVDVLSIIPSP